jgi:hypothetical protein
MILSVIVVEGSSSINLYRLPSADFKSVFFSVISLASKIQDKLNFSTPETQNPEPIYGAPLISVILP